MSGYLWAALLVVAYALPWMLTPPVVGLTNSAYDLAEWLSIHPAVRADALLLTPLLLRLPLVGVAMLTGLLAPRRHGLLLQLLIVGMVAAALLPPLEFFSTASGDPNYRQSFLLACCALVFGAAAIMSSRSAPSWLRAKLITACLTLGVMTGAGVWGLFRALELMDAATQHAQVGVGPVLFVVFAVSCTAWLIASQRVIVSAGQN